MRRHPTKRIVEVVLRHEHGERSDAQITLDGGDHRVEIPEKGAKLQLSLSCEPAAVWPWSK